MFRCTCAIHLKSLPNNLFQLLFKHGKTSISERREGQSDKLSNPERKHRFYTWPRMKSRSTHQHVYVRDAVRAAGLQTTCTSFHRNCIVFQCADQQKHTLASAIWSQTILFGSPSEEARRCKSACLAAVEIQIVNKHKMCRIRSDTTFRIYLSAHKLL